LQPGSKAAAVKLLGLVPKSDDEQTALMTVGDSLCDAESDTDMLVLSQVYEGMPKALALAVLVAPEFIPQYVKYALRAFQDAHSDYAERMRPVCQQAHRRFLSAVESLDESDRRTFRHYVMVPESCRVLAGSEAN
jgi:hypothetical protein